MNNRTEKPVVGQTKRNEPDREIDFSQSVMSILSQLERPMLWQCAGCKKGYARPNPRAPFSCVDCGSGQIINPATGE